MDKGCLLSSPLPPCSAILWHMAQTRIRQTCFLTANLHFFFPETRTPASLGFQKTM